MNYPLLSTPHLKVSNVILTIFQVNNASLFIESYTYDGDFRSKCYSYTYRLQKIQQSGAKISLQ